MYLRLFLDKCNSCNRTQLYHRS
ncbi:tetracycline resistance efflux system leader peptide [uncultured Eubacterium sp.]